MYRGGYYTLREPLVRASLHTHSTNDPDGVSDAALDGINIIQSTPWRINTRIASLMTQVWANGDTLGGLPTSDDEPLPPTVPADEFEAMTPTEKHAFKAHRASIQARNDSARSKRLALIRKLRVAEDMKDEPAIYFPHFVDFRNRVYPMPQDLTPQGDDTAKALLEFGEARPLGPNGLDWLATKLAGCAGQDKLSYDDRIRWVNANLEAIEDSVDAPLDGSRFWASDGFDEPWSFLATAVEFVDALRSPDHTLHPARQPIPLDGSTNGLQHLSLMGRDPVGAIATNCSGHPDRQDLYQDVADKVQDLVMADAIEGFASARVWMQRGIHRKTVKRSVMTTPYGVTPTGIRDQLIQDGFCHGMGMDSAKHAGYLRDRIVDGLSETVSSAKEIMTYLQSVSGTLADAGRPLAWTTPIGSRVTQSYRRLTGVRIVTLMGRITLHKEDAHLMDVKKQRLAAAPNVVHSFDAAMLLDTVTRMHAKGARCFAMIHDSYGVHPDLTDELVATLRESAYDIYKDDWLGRMHEDFTQQMTGLDAPPSPPERGDFDPAEVLSAPYFFS